VNSAQLPAIPKFRNDSCGPSRKPIIQGQSRFSVRLHKQINGRFAHQGGGGVLTKQESDSTNFRGTSVL
jgi:hypothetical protein